MPTADAGFLPKETVAGQKAATLEKNDALFEKIYALFEKIYVPFEKIEATFEKQAPALPQHHLRALAAITILWHKKATSHNNMARKHRKKRASC